MTGVAGESSPQSLPWEDALLADAMLGGGLPPEAEQHLWQAGLSYLLDESQRAICAKRSLAPGHAAGVDWAIFGLLLQGALGEALDVPKRV